MLRLSLFGFPTVTYNNRPVTDFISQKSLVLLCYLAIEPRVHARETLAGLFWSDLPQERALSNLRQALHNIQKLLPAYIAVTRQTAAFETNWRFEIDVAALDADPTGVDLLVIYRDDFMAGVVIADAAEIEQWIDQKREHYRLRYAAQLNALLIELFNRRQTEQVELVARRLIEHDPYREFACHVLWRVLVQQGRTAEALLSADALRDRLRDDLDISPAPETLLMIRQLALVRGSTRHNIPTPFSAFVGRDEEIARIGSLLKQAEWRLVTLCGIGGVGKSRLAQEFGRAEAGFYLNGAAYIALGGLSDTAYLHTALADALGISLQNVHDPQREIAAFLAEREMLLIFDNAEHLPGFALWLSNLFPIAPYIKTIVTSRQRLDLREEWVVVLDGLPFGPSPETPSVELLVKTAERSGQRIDRNADTMALCALLEGLPLGIELAGAMLTRSTASDLLQAVRANLDTLQARWVNTEQYHRSLRAIFQTSWDRLSHEEQSVLANLAVFEGGFTRNAAQSVADASETLLKRLETFSLVREALQGWSLHRVIRNYAREQQVAPDELLTRFENYVLRLLKQAEGEFTARNIRTAVEITRAEVNSLRQLWQIAVDRRSSELLIKLSFAMHRYYEGAGLFAEGLSLFRSGLDNLELDKFKPDDLRLLGRLRMHEAGMLLRLGKVSDAFSSACDAVECLSQDENDPAALAFALNTLGISQLYQGDMNSARHTLEQCAAIYRQLEMPELLKPLVNLGAIYSRTGDIGNAYEVLQEAHGIARRIGDTVGGFHVVNALGLNRMLCDEYDAALGYFEEALALSETTGFQSGKVIVLNNLGDIHNLMGRAQTGVSYAENAVVLARELEDQRGLVYSLSTLTLIQLALRQSEAVTTLREALQRAKETGATPLMTTALYAAGEWYASVNRQADAYRVWHVISIHPATEMDYRRRATAHLGQSVACDHSTENPLPEIIGQILAELH